MEEKPLEHLDDILRRVVQEVFAEDVPETVKEKAEEIVAKYDEKEESILSQHYGIKELDWESFARDIDRVQAMLDLWQSEVEDRRIAAIDAEDEEILLLLL